MNNNNSQTLYNWVSHPFVDEKLIKTGMLCLSVLVVFILINITFNFYYALISLIFLFLSFRKYFLPTEYHLYEKGLRIKFGLSNKNKSWQQYKRSVILKDGIFLSSMQKSSRLDTFRGDFLKFGSQTPVDQITNFIKQNVGKNEPQ